LGRWLSVPLLPLSNRTPSPLGFDFRTVYISTDTQFMIRLGAGIVRSIGIAACNWQLATCNFPAANTIRLQVREVSAFETNWNLGMGRAKHLQIYGRHLPKGAKNLLHKPSV